MGDEKKDKLSTNNGQEKAKNNTQKSKGLSKVTIIGIITAITALLVLITHLDTVIDIINKRFFSERESIPEVKDKVTKDPVIEACELINVKFFPVFPYYLVNTYNKTPYDSDYVYWVAICGKNTCKQRLQIRLRFKPDPLVATVGKEEHDYTVEALKTIDHKVDPRLEIKKATDEFFSLPGDWKILSLSDSKVHKILKQGPFEITVIAKNHVYWDLKDPDKKPVDFGFLLASLSAWSILPKKPPQELRERASSYLSQGNGPDQWLQNCYTDLFRSGTPVRVHPYGDPWPLRMEGLNSQQRIRTWKEVLAGKKADSLEAALLMAALKNAVAEDLKFRLVLFALPAYPEKDEGEKRFLLAWSPKGRVWQAIDLTEPNNHDFDLNLRQASARLNEVLQTQGNKIFLLLNKKGVFYEEKKKLAEQTLLALDLKIASGYYYISGLREE